MTLLQFMHTSLALGATFGINARIAHFPSCEDATIAYHLIKEVYPNAFIKHYENIVAFPRN